MLRYMPGIIQLQHPQNTCLSVQGTKFKLDDFILIFATPDAFPKTYSTDLDISRGNNSSKLSLKKANVEVLALGL